MNATFAPTLIAGAAFDSIADQYDELFTKSLVGRAQRGVVWRVVDRTFSPGEKILELNCGTGEDALHLAQRGVNVVACDASSRMVEVARQKAALSPGISAAFHRLQTERVMAIGFRGPFDGLLSNFAGLNCVQDLADIADQLASLLRPGAPAILCLSTRYCLWEIVSNGLQGRWKKAFRRCSGRARANLGGIDISVTYPTVREMRRLLSPWFRLRSVTAVGLAVPPSYMEAWCGRHPHIFRILTRLDELLRSCPGLRGLGDHVLLVFERCEQ